MKILIPITNDKEKILAEQTLALSNFNNNDYILLDSKEYENCLYSDLLNIGLNKVKSTDSFIVLKPGDIANLENINNDNISIFYTIDKSSEFTLSGKIFLKSVIESYDLRFCEGIESNICEYGFIEKYLFIYQNIKTDNSQIVSLKNVDIIDITNIKEYINTCTDLNNFLYDCGISNNKYIETILSQFITMYFYCEKNINLNKKIDNDIDTIKLFFEQFIIPFINEIDPEQIVQIYNNILLNILENKNYLYEAVLKFNDFTFLKYLNCFR